MAKTMFKTGSSRYSMPSARAPQSGVSMTVTGLRLSTAEIVADYLKGRRPMTSPAADQYSEASDDHAGFTSSFYDHEFLQRAKSDNATRIQEARNKLAADESARTARLAALEAHFEKTKHMFDPPPAEK
jgi:hypothetical protein